MSLPGLSCWIATSPGAIVNVISATLEFPASSQNDTCPFPLDRCHFWGREIFFTWKYNLRSASHWLECQTVKINKTRELYCNKSMINCLFVLFFSANQPCNRGRTHNRDVLCFQDVCSVLPEGGAAVQQRSAGRWSGDVAEETAKTGPLHCQRVKNWALNGDYGGCRFSFWHRITKKFHFYL